MIFLTLKASKLKQIIIKLNLLKLQRARRYRYVETKELSTH